MLALGLLEAFWRFWFLAATQRRCRQLSRGCHCGQHVSAGGGSHQGALQIYMPLLKEVNLALCCGTLLLELRIYLLTNN